NSANPQFARSAHSNRGSRSKRSIARAMRFTSRCIQRSATCCTRRCMCEVAELWRDDVIPSFVSEWTEDMGNTCSETWVTHLLLTLLPSGVHWFIAREDRFVRSFDDRKRRSRSHRWSWLAARPDNHGMLYQRCRPFLDIGNDPWHPP